MSEPSAPPSTAFDLFHPKIQKWVYDSGWRHLRDVQEQAAPPILAGDRDVILAAATASGKTEAAWLPICTALATDSPAAPGIKALYVSPLKALINDQHDRLGEICAQVNIPVHRWHGDVAGSRKSALVKKPDGVLLITPESLEALFVNRGHDIPRLLGTLRYIVIDELHAFMGSERGAQLQSLLHRTERASGRLIPRVALSATLGDYAAARRFLRPGHSESVIVVASDTDARELQLQVRGYIAADPQRSGVPSEADATLTATDEPDEHDDEDAEPTHQAAIADHLFRTLRGTDNLVFANRRSAVEAYADKLARRCTEARVPVEFLPHHGNLSKEVREHVEARLKSREAPLTAICTSTLEMGIDIGAVKSIGQVGVPITVSSLRQRLGRSGRTGTDPSILRIYISEQGLNQHTPPVDCLRSELFQTVAMVELLLQKWYEPPDVSSLHLSTLIQQVLSVIAERGGATARTLHSLLCGPGPFERVDTNTFQLLLRSMGKRDLLHQASDGLLLPGTPGERLINHYSFYAAFQTLDEYRLVAEGRTLGSLPIDHPVVTGMLIIFGGRRWKVLNVDTSTRVINLERSKGGKPPSFPGGGGNVSDEVRQAMRQLYTSDHIPTYLDRTAQRLLAEGRAAYQRYELTNHTIVGWGNDTLLFPWCGDKVMNTLAVTFTSHGHDVGQDGIALTLTGIAPDRLFRLIQTLATAHPPLATDLATNVSVKTNDKYDEYLDEPLLNAAYAARALDIPAAWKTLNLLATLPPPTPSLGHRPP